MFSQCLHGLSLDTVVSQYDPQTYAWLNLEDVGKTPPPSPVAVKIFTQTLLLCADAVCRLPTDELYIRVCPQLLFSNEEKPHE